jgi:holo-[acyl-carrier protein] synthase
LSAGAPRRIFPRDRLQTGTLARKAVAMIVGIGVDMVRTERVWAVLERKGERAYARFFTAAERERCGASRHPPESFAARFAAKEALYKAMGTGVGIAGAWTEVEVVSAESGAPSIRLSGRAAERAAERGVRRVHLSLTHTGDTAAAFVVLEG